jgi:hypothetical protein
LWRQRVDGFDVDANGYGIRRSGRRIDEQHLVHDLDEHRFVVDVDRLGRSAGHGRSGRRIERRR